MSFDIELGPPRPETMAVAVKELRETEENVKNGLEMLKKLLAEDTTLYYSTDDDFLMIFLRPCKFYPVSAFELMRRAADFKHKNASLFENLMPSDERTAFLEHNVLNVLKGRDHKGRRVMVVNSGKTWDPSKVTANQILRLFYLVHDVAMLEPETQINGTVVIMDFEELSMKQVKGLTPSYSMKLLTFIQEAMPLRLKEVHFVKQPFLFNMIWQMFKPFVKEKLKKRMFFHGSAMASLHQHIPKTHLPENYGGDLPKIDYTSADWFPTLIKCEDKIKAWNSYGLRKKD
ncbi:retinaldehyde-binding protein 1 isoform X1 [Augochlora pura]